GLLWTLNKFAYHYNNSIEEIMKKDIFPSFELDYTKEILNYIFNISSVYLTKNKTEYLLLNEWFKNILAELQGGLNPFSKSFMEAGKYVNNHTLFKKDNQYYLYYTSGILDPALVDVYYFGFRMKDNEKSIKLAVSDDLKNWDLKGDVFKVPDNSWDSRVVWSPHVFENNGQYYIFYTGGSRQITQKIGMAVSSDLINWERNESPVFSPDTSWAYYTEGSWADCRAPMVIKEGNNFIMYYTARKKDFNFVIGCAVSDDLTNWEDRGPVLEGARVPLESPFVVKIGDIYHMFYTVSGNKLFHAVSRDPISGWQNAGGDAFEVTGFEGNNIELIKDGNDFLISYNQGYPHLIALVRFDKLTKDVNNIFELTGIK
ncbi:family 43 glycosylhydrolase, partial [candidate division KSB1 bacterium]